MKQSSYRSQRGLVIRCAAEITISCFALNFPPEVLSQDAMGGEMAIVVNPVEMPEASLI